MQPHELPATPPTSFQHYAQLDLAPGASTILFERDSRPASKRRLSPHQKRGLFVRIEVEYRLQLELNPFDVL